jgi:hypothetical protein
VRHLVVGHHRAHSPAHVSVECQHRLGEFTPVFDAAQAIHRLFLAIHLGVRHFDPGEPEFAQNACYARRVEMAREPPERSKAYNG